MKLEIVKYEFQMIRDEPKIVISMVKMMEDDGKYIKFGKMTEVLPLLAECSVTFKKRDQ